MSIASIIGGLFKPAADLIDNLVTSDKERGELQVALTQVQNQATQQLLNYEARVLEAQSNTIRAEAQGKSWIQRSWRPITMLTFLGLVVADTFGLTEFRLAQEAWTLLQIGLGGYVVGRSAEKVAPQITKALGK